MLDILYEVTDEFGSVLASNIRELQMVFAFIRGYREQFYREKLNLTIRQMNSYEDDLEEERK